MRCRWCFQLPDECPEGDKADLTRMPPSLLRLARRSTTAWWIEMWWVGAARSWRAWHRRTGGER